MRRAIVVGCECESARVNSQLQIVTEEGATHMRFWPSESSTREVPQDELAILADRGESHRPLVRSPWIPCDASDPRGVTLTASDQSLLERSVDGAEIVLPTSLRASEGQLSLRDQVRVHSPPRNDHQGSRRRKRESRNSRQRCRGACEGERRSVEVSQRLRETAAHFSSAALMIRRQPSSPTVAQS